MTRSARGARRRRDSGAASRRERRFRAGRAALPSPGDRGPGHVDVLAARCRVARAGRAGGRCDADAARRGESLRVPPRRAVLSAGGPGAGIWLCRPAAVHPAVGARDGPAVRRLAGRAAAAVGAGGGAGGAADRVDRPRVRWWARRAAAGRGVDRGVVGAARGGASDVDGHLRPARLDGAVLAAGAGAARWRRGVDRGGRGRRGHAAEQDAAGVPAGRRACRRPAGGAAAGVAVAVAVAGGAARPGPVGAEPGVAGRATGSRSWSFRPRSPPGAPARASRGICSSPTSCCWSARCWCRCGWPGGGGWRATRCCGRGGRSPSCTCWSRRCSC